MPAITALTAVTLTLAAPSFAITVTSAPTRSSPSIRNAVFGFESLILAFFAAAVNAVASEGTKSTRSEERRVGKEYRCRWTRWQERKRKKSSRHGGRVHCQSQIR